jgi:hypothetical protein
MSVIFGYEFYGVMTLMFMVIGFCIVIYYLDKYTKKFEKKINEIMEILKIKNQ